jgi:hypothetical protein
MKRAALILGAVMGAVMSFPAAAIAQTAAVPNYELSGLTAADLDIISRGLAEIPYKDAAPLIQKLRQQIINQQQAAAAAETAQKAAADAQKHKDIDAAVAAAKAEQQKADASQASPAAAEHRE